MHTTASLRPLLEQHGFVAETNNGNIDLVKRMKACDMPYMAEHVVDNEIVGEIDIVVITVTHDNMVRMHVERTDYVEDPVPVASEDARGVLVDAGVPMPVAAFAA